MEEYFYTADNKPSARRRMADISMSSAKVLFTLALIVLGVSFAPSVVYKLMPNKLNISLLLQKTAIRNPNDGRLGDVVENKEKPVYQPRHDASLPAENTLVIKSIGINTKINEATYEGLEEALKKGVWRAPDFGTPSSRETPTILAAHRYGYLAWSIPYRLKNSFFNLPKVKTGDTVEIVWRQRKYTYEVYSEAKGEGITDYTADLILYTCESLNSPVRIFKYARLLEI